MRERSKRRLGEILIEDGVLSQENLDEALVQQKKDGGVIGQILIRLGYVTEENLIAALCKQLTIPYLPLTNYAVNTEVTRTFRYDFCKQNLLVAFDRDDKYIFIATADPLNDISLDYVGKESGRKAQIFISTPTEILNLLDLAFASDAGIPKTT